jgi:hypothetical protein
MSLGHWCEPEGQRVVPHTSELPPIVTAAGETAAGAVSEEIPIVSEDLTLALGQAHAVERLSAGMPPDDADAKETSVRLREAQSAAFPAGRPGPSPAGNSAPLALKANAHLKAKQAAVQRNAKQEPIQSNVQQTAVQRNAKQEPIQSNVQQTAVQRNAQQAPVQNNVQHTAAKRNAQQAYTQGNIPQRPAANQPMNATSTVSPQFATRTPLRDAPREPVSPRTVPQFADATPPAGWHSPSGIPPTPRPEGPAPKAPDPPERPKAPKRNQPRKESPGGNLVPTEVYSKESPPRPRTRMPESGMGPRP